MVISSIDLKGGHVVQLRNGRESVLERDDAQALMKEFSKYGEVAVIDLDAAAGKVNEKGETENTPIIKMLLRKGNVRTGGGVRSVDRARELVALGAEKVIVGSAAWKKEVKAGECPLDTEFLDALEAAIGRQRIIIAVDAMEGKIAIEGWTKTLNVPLLIGAKAAEKYAAELLFTCIEKEGCMKGTDMIAAQNLRQAVKCRLVVAGGVSSVEEIAALQKAGCDVQLGMALYTGAVSLKEAFIECIDWTKAPLVPVVVQSVNGEVLMVGHTNREALAKTFDIGRLTFWSRTRGELWTKGDTSGHYLELVRMRADCDRDTILATAIPHGGVCHTGSFTCFSNAPDEKSTAQRLYDIIADRFKNPKPGSYTATLNSTRVREKIMEEAEELTSDAKTREDIVWESSDLFYFMSVLLYKEGVTWQDVYDELDRRHKE